MNPAHIIWECLTNGDWGLGHTFADIGPSFAVAADALFSEGFGLAACPPVVQYSMELQARAAEELAMLADGSVVVEMMGDYAVMRDQVRGC